MRRHYLLADLRCVCGGMLKLRQANTEEHSPALDKWLSGHLGAGHGALPGSTITHACEDRLRVFMVRRGGFPPFSAVLSSSQFSV